MADLQQSWSAFRKASYASKIIKSSIDCTDNTVSKSSVAHLPASYVAPDKVSYTRPNALSYEQQRYYRESYQLKLVAEQVKMSKSAFYYLIGFVSDRVLYAWNLSYYSEGENKVLDILSNMGYLSRNSSVDLQRVEQQIYPVLMYLGGLTHESVRLLIFGVEFGAMRAKFSQELDKILGDNADEIIRLVYPFSDLKYSRMARAGTPFEYKIERSERLRRQGNPVEDDYCSFQPALNYNKMSISDAQIRREKLFLIERIPIHNQQVASFVEHLIQQGKEDYAAQYAKVNLIPVVYSYDTQEERARYYHWLGVLKAEQIKETMVDYDALEIYYGPDIRKSMISFQIAKYQPENRIPMTQAYLLRYYRIREQIKEGEIAKLEQKRAETLQDTPVITERKYRAAERALSASQAPETNIHEETAINEHIYRYRIAYYHRAEQELAQQMLGRTLAGRTELEMTAAAARITERMTQRQLYKDARKVLVNLEIAVRPRKSGKLVVREGDSIYDVVVGFCRTYALKEDKLIKLKKELENFLQANKIPFESTSDEQAIWAFRGGRKAREETGKKELSRTHTPVAMMAGSALESQPTKDALAEFVSDDLWEELGLVY